MRPAFSQNVVVVDVDVKEVAKGYRASELTGADVENSAGETIGSIDDLIAARRSCSPFSRSAAFWSPFPAIRWKSARTAKIVLARGSKEDLKKLPEFKYDRK